MASSKTGTNIVALRYASAFIDLAEEKKALGKVEKDLADLSAMISDSDDLQALAKNPIISRSDKSEALAALGKKAKFQTITTNFLRVIAENGRFDVIEDIIAEFNGVLRERRGEVEATVQSAYALSSAQSKAIQKQLSDAMGSNVTLNVEVNKDLLGGMVVTVGSTMIDDSVRRKLDVLGRKMATGTH